MPSPHLVQSCHRCHCRCTGGTAADATTVALQQLHAQCSSNISSGSKPDMVAASVAAAAPCPVHWQHRRHENQAWLSGGNMECENGKLLLLPNPPPQHALPICSLTRPPACHSFRLPTAGLSPQQVGYVKLSCGNLAAMNWQR